jgi:hypothetical protein
MQSHKAGNIEALRRRDTRSARISSAMALMGLTAIAAPAATATRIQAVRDAEPEARLIETWLPAGLVLISGLLALIACRPVHHAGLWKLAIVNKPALAFVAPTYASDADGAAGIGHAGGILTTALLTAYPPGRTWCARSRTVRPGP